MALGKAVLIATFIAALGAAVGVSQLAWRWVDLPIEVGMLVTLVVTAASIQRGGRSVAPVNLANGVAACLGLAALAALLGAVLRLEAAVLAVLAIGAATAGAFWLQGQALGRLAAAAELDREDRWRLVSASLLLAVAALDVAALWPLVRVVEPVAYVVFAAVVLGAALLAGLSFVGDARRWRWLKRLYAGEVAERVVTSRAGGAPYLGGVLCDAAVQIGTPGETPFRDAATGAVACAVPARFEPAGAVLAPRLKWAAAILVAAGGLSAALALQVRGHAGRLYAGQLALGPDHSCATSHDRVVCWGAVRRLGSWRRPRVVRPAYFPEALNDRALGSLVVANDRVSVSAGVPHGDSWSAPVGDGSLGDEARAERDRAELAASQGHVCEATRGGGVRCRGRNGDGELGWPPSDDRLDWRDVPGVTGAAEVVGAPGLSCARTERGEVWCWGRLQHQRATGAEPLRPTRLPVTEPLRALYVDGGRAWALATGGGVVSWDGGSNVAYPLASRVVTALRPARDRWCALDLDGVVTCWPAGHPEAMQEVLREVRQLESGARHHCALLRDGTVRCWGANDRGQLGDGTRRNRARPVFVRE